MGPLAGLAIVLAVAAAAAPTLAAAPRTAKAKAVSGIWLWLILIPDTAYALCLLLGVVLTVQGQMTVGVLLAFFATAAVMRFPIESIGFLLSMALDTRNALDRYFEVLSGLKPGDEVVTGPYNSVRAIAPSPRRRT